GQLSLLADGHEARRKLVGQRSAQDEAARLDAGDLVDAEACIGPHKLVDRLPEGGGITQERGDVAEYDPGLGVVMDGANGRGKIDGLSHDGHMDVLMKIG